MAQEPIGTLGNYFHIYDFKVKPGTADEFIKKFVEFDYSDGNPMHKSPAQVKDGVLCRDVKDPNRFWLIAEWSDIEVHASIREQLVELHPEFVDYIEDVDKGAFVPDYGEIVSATPQEILDQAAK